MSRGQACCGQNVCVCDSEGRSPDHPNYGAKPEPREDLRNISNKELIDEAIKRGILKEPK